MLTPPIPSFKVAILADIHGNRDALSAVLADVQQQTPDLLILAGDLVMNGPHPRETLDTLVDLDVPSIVGNTDDEVITGNDPVAAWTQQQIGGKGIMYLQSLVTAFRITPPHCTSPQDDLLVVHSTPRSCYDVLILEPHPLGTTFTTPTPAAEATQMLGRTHANLLVYGHIHYASQGIVNGQRVASVGSVGFPFDGDQRAAYAIAEWNEHTWRLKHRRVVYNYEQVASDIEQSTLPFASRYARMIREANWVPRPD